MGERVLSIYQRLLARYGQLHWWPADTVYEVMVGAVLTQNTAWRNVEIALANFGGNISPESVSDMSMEALAQTIRPAGFFNQKSKYLKAMTAWFETYGFDREIVRREPLEKVRKQLLAVKGIGRETADSILLYAFGYPIFVVDAYTLRHCRRYPLDAGNGYEEVRAYFEDGLPKREEVFNNFHAMIVANAKEYCRTRPQCEACPLGGECERSGV